MPEPLGPIPLSPRPAPAPDRLDSWKEIATYLGREIRTVQLWEKNEGLPIHRHQHSRQGSVYAFKRELDSWRQSRKNIPDPPPSAPAPLRRPVALIAGSLLILAAAGFILWKTRQTSSSGPALSSVVVLPFLDLSPQKDQDYFSDGLTEEIIDALSRVPNLRVVARTSAFAFKGKNTDTRQIGRQLNVSAVLEGSVRKDGDQLRITAQLNRVTDGTHLWSRTFDRQLRDIFTVQREISQSIADQLRAGEVPARPSTTDLEAYGLYQEGRFFFNQEIPDALPKARERYQKAIARDPKFALAYAGLADTYAYQAEVRLAIPPKEVMPKAKEFARQAIALDDNVGEAHTSLGIVLLDYEWDIPAAQREFRRAMQLSPGSGYVHHWYAHSLEAQDRVEEAMKEMRASLALDPLSLIIRSDLVTELVSVKRYDEALRELDKTDELTRSDPAIGHIARAEVYYRKGDVRQARRFLDLAIHAQPQINGDPFFMGLSGVVLAKEGRRSEARQILDHLEQVREAQYVDGFVGVELSSALGDRERLLRWFRRAYDERSGALIYAPLFWKDIYSRDPELAAFVAKAH
jgi:TolB-like protein/Tfp pilus assembly protein PilF